LSALDRQVGEDRYGSPYRSFAIQPAEFCQRNQLDWCQANIVKYICRFRLKNGKEDLAKARHYLDMLEEFEYGKETEAPEVAESDSPKPWVNFIPTQGLADNLSQIIKKSTPNKGMG
jgi:hypothetical protein